MTNDKKQPAEARPANEVTDDQVKTIFWDDIHIEAEAEFFPGELSDLYRRVKLKCREDFGGDMKRITEAFAKLGIKRDITTWSRIFKKSRWNHNAEGDPLPSPLVSAEKLQQEFQSFLQQTRVELMRNRMPFVETSIWTMNFNFIVKKKMRLDRVNKFGVITGPTGLQKSACFKELAQRDPNIKHLECAENTSTNQLISMLAYKYGISIYRNVVEKRFAIYENFGPGKCIIFDNTQDLRSTKDKQTAELDKFFKFCRWLQDERGGTIIWSITPQDVDEIFPERSGKAVFMEQFEGRAGGRDSFLKLPNDNPTDDLVAIAESIGMVNPGKHAALLQRAGTLRGRIRTFYEILQDAKFLADKAKGRLTADIIEDVMMERVESRKKEDPK